ncbi:MAG: NAD(+) kinase [Gloeomargarita sp. SKYBB_i_bin120]|nr:NAD(+) kinase [Gloeomargarita sp. SKYG98]MCS7292100.1 NAD(+) kinase [Gloeomargarita sp. SKYB120]MDW8177660.1 NAD(+) kinase [Gloeomargarita sp. SKYBB_i_bin120]
MGKIGIIYNDGKPEAAQFAQELQEWLQQRGRQVCVATGVGGLLGYAQPGSPVCHTPVEWLVPPGFDRDVELTIVLGGDGTVLAASRQCAPLGIPLLTVNTGHLGFLTEIYVESLPSVLETVLSGDYQVEERITLLVQVWEGDTRIWEALALNEVVLHREPLAKLCHFEVQVGCHAVVDIPADGVIVSTPTGSTAYALSAGGPVLAPGVAALLLIPICPHSLASRALVFNDRETVHIWAANASRLVLVADGNAGCYVQPGYHVTIQRSPYMARFVRLRPPEFFHVLRQKLGWGLPHQAKPKG